jgi:hypothetical protein
MPVLDEFKPNKPLAEFVRENLQQDVAVGSMLNGQIDASTVFYMRRRVTLLDNASEAAQFLAAHESRLLTEQGDRCLILWDQDIPAVEALLGDKLDITASARDASVVTAPRSLSREPHVLDD